MTKEPPRETVVLGVGRWWDPGKNGAILDEAAATSPWPVILAGPLTGPNGQRTDFRNVRTLGTLPHSEILALMRRSAIFAAPSRYEPFGLAVVEAAISGAALVLADIPTFRELWSDAALFVDPTDSNGWSRALAALAADTVLRERLSAAAGARARQFTLSRQSAQLYGLYSSLTTPAAAGMKFVLYAHSVVSDWNNGNAHFLRGILSDLERRGHSTRVLEPEDGWSRANLIANHGTAPLEALRRHVSPPACHHLRGRLRPRSGAGRRRRGDRA